MKPAGCTSPENGSHSRARACGSTATSIFSKCAYAITPSAQSFAATGGSGTISITTDTNSAFLERWKRALRRNFDERLIWHRSWNG